MNKKQIIEKIDSMSIEEILYEDDQSVLREELPSLQEFFPLNVAAAGLGAVMGVMLRTAIEKRRVKKYIEQGKKLCDKYEGKKKEKCLQDVKKIAIERKIMALRDVYKECNKKFDDDKKIKKCQAIINDKIKKANEDHKKTLRWLGMFQPNAIVAQAK